MRFDYPDRRRSRPRVPLVPDCIRYIPAINTAVEHDKRFFEKAVSTEIITIAERTKRARETSLKVSFVLSKSASHCFAGFLGVRARVYFRVLWLTAARVQ